MSPGTKEHEHEIYEEVSRVINRLEWLRGHAFGVVGLGMGSAWYKSTIASYDTILRTCYRQVSSSTAAR